MPHHWQPTFIGIGAQKSATTWCAEVLRQHPDVCIAQPKELNYFHANFERGHDWYARHFRNPFRKCQGEISPLYMDHPDVADRIAEAYPNVIILAVLRNPFERAISNLLHDVRGIEGQIAAIELNRIRQLARSSDKYVRRSCYASALAPYIKRLSRAQISVLFYEHIQSDPRAFLRSLYSVVGAPPDFVPSNYSVSVNRTEDYAFPTLFRWTRRASQLANSWLPTRSGMQWIYRNTRLREWVVYRLTIDRGRPDLDFDDLFGKAARVRITEDIDRLQAEMRLDVPPRWRSHLSANQAYAA